MCICIDVTSIYHAPSMLTQAGINVLRYIYYGNYIYQVIYLVYRTYIYITYIPCDCSWIIFLKTGISIIILISLHKTSFLNITVLVHCIVEYLFQIVIVRCDRKIQFRWIAVTRIYMHFYSTFKVTSIFFRTWRLILFIINI